MVPGAGARLRCWLAIGILPGTTWREPRVAATYPAWGAGNAAGNMPGNTPGTPYKPDDTRIWELANATKTRAKTNRHCNMAAVNYLA
ncbi:hypothetical protein L798_10972 [Zootermopsis nevadensis]|uniref:Secreted protein n=1 Tax=Zootermopsis nevadensis TaxID=136037 RepID=A0A067R6Y4_ZOONE|nr:hypothetical protein L798_10972 [Zootermopsis nevadensis]